MPISRELLESAKPFVYPFPLVKRDKTDTKKSRNFGSAILYNEKVIKKIKSLVVTFRPSFLRYRVRTKERYIGWVTKSRTP